MWFIIRLHYAYRLLLIYLDCLRGFASVHAETRSVCCYAAHPRSASTSSQQTQEHHPHTIPTQIRDSKALIGPMKPSTVVNCTVANEVLRRRTRLQRDPTIRPCRNSDQYGCLKSTDSSPQIPTHGQPFHQEARNQSAGRPSGIEEGRRHKIRPLGDVDNYYRTGIAVRRRRHNMWKLGLDPDRKNNSIFAVSRRDTNLLTQETSIAPQPSPQEFDDWSRDDSSDAREGAQEWPTRTNIDCGPKANLQDRGRLSAINDEVESDNNFRSYISKTSDMGVRRNPQPHQPTSPTSDTTLYESASNSLCSQLETGIGPWDNPPHTEFDYDRVASPEAIQLEKHVNQTPTPVRRHWTHQREMSIDSSFSSARTPMPLRVRARTNDGLLQFMASTSCDTIVPNGVRRTHRRKISLNIPVKGPQRRSETIQHPNLGIWNGPPYRAVVPSDKQSRPLTHEERELEYKHRHTFIGTTSLDDCLEALEVSSTYATTKVAVARAFISLASNEQIHARQCSTRPEGWELVPRVTSEISSIDYVAQLQVKLGSITLRQFLGMIPFDENDEVGALRVVEAFSAASHLDAQAGIGTGRKARAFRNWMVTQHRDIV